ELINDLESHHLGISDAVKHAIGLNAYAHDTRYPGVGEPVTSEEHRHAVDMAKAVVSWAEAFIL
ncbi:MAG: HEPN domain-containing protein, partial [bacterium]